MNISFAGSISFAVVLAIIVMYYESRIMSNLEQILVINLKKFDCQSMACYTYEGLSWILLIDLSIMAVVMFSPLMYIDFPAYIGLLFFFIYPPVVMIIRNGTFNDYSIPSEENPVYVDSDVFIDGPGYNPFYYLLYSFPYGILTVGGFAALNSPNNPIAEGIFLILLGLILQTFVLFPDVINRISPVDLRTKKGMQLMNTVMGIVTTTIFLIAHFASRM